MSLSVGLRNLRAVFLSALAVLLVHHSAHAGGGSEDAEAPAAKEAPAFPMSEDGRIHPIGSAAHYFSDLGRGGYGLYEQSCARCHGHFGEGVGQAPGLLTDDLLEGNKARRTFHTRFNDLTEAHRILTAQDSPELGFNQLEIIAKYLRELGQWARETGDSGANAKG